MWRTKWWAGGVFYVSLIVQASSDKLQSGYLLMRKYRKWIVNIGLTCRKSFADFMKEIIKAGNANERCRLLERV